MRSEGQVSVFDPLRGGPCYRCLYPDDTASNAMSCSENGVLAPLVVVIGSLQAMEAVKLLAGFGDALRGKLLMLDLRSMEMHRLNVSARPDCAHLRG